jgi:HAD superfamily hydrolase (TIGR01509 family)
MRFADLDAVTLDAFGTLLTLIDPVPELEESLRAQGIACSAERITAGFDAEGEYYKPRSLDGRDEASLAALRLECTRVFLENAGVDLDPAEFVDAYIEAQRFELLPGAAEAVASLRRRGLALAVVGNWDLTLPGHVAALGLDGLPVVTSAAAGAAKPDPRPFRLALDELAVRPERALHIGNEEADELGARATGMHFALAPVGAALEAVE